MTDAKRSLGMLEDIACRTGLKCAGAGAARCRGILAGEDGYEGEFQAALALYGEEMAFERARTQLALGIVQHGDLIAEESRCLGRACVISVLSCDSSSLRSSRRNAASRRLISSASALGPANPSRVSSACDSNTAAGSRDREDLRWACRAVAWAVPAPRVASA